MNEGESRNLYLDEQLWDTTQLSADFTQYNCTGIHCLTNGHHIRRRKGKDERDPIECRSSMAWLLGL